MLNYYNMAEIKLTKGQQRAFDGLKDFFNDTTLKVFVLKGYAGTGKTTLMQKLIKEMQKRSIPCTLLASTGRAAKILSNFTGSETKTVHSEIYKFTDINQDLESITNRIETTKVDNSGQLLLTFDLVPIEDGYGSVSQYYIVDEASMISDEIDNGAIQAVFGSGKLLSDLFRYDSRGKFIFVGDVCQLPPVSQSISPALSVSYIKKHFGYECVEYELTEVVRQSADVDIVRSAHKVRRLFHEPQPFMWARFPFRGYKDIHILNSSMSLINGYIERVKKCGFNEATLLCHSNKQCNEITRLLRPAFGHSSSQLEVGDLLLVTQNNLITGLMNGDLVVVEDISNYEYRAGLTFMKVTVKELFTQRTFSQLMIADVLYANQTNITQSQHKSLLIDFFYRMKEKDIRQGSERFNSFMRNDPYLNALRAVYGYALTCHKSQGGEWNYVYLNIPRYFPKLEKPYVYQWVYTAMTRAKKGLYVVDDFWVE